MSERKKEFLYHRVSEIDRIGIKAISKKEAEEFSVRYNLKARLDTFQIDIFKSYFAAFWISTDELNSNIIDAAFGNDIDTALKTPILGKFAKVMKNFSYSMTKAANELRDEAEKLSEKYHTQLERDGGALSQEDISNHGMNLNNITPSKLKQLANNVNLILAAGYDKQEEEELINEYIDEELPAVSSN